MSTKFNDSVSDYSNHDFSQISDVSVKLVTSDLSVKLVITDEDYKGNGNAKKTSSIVIENANADDAKSDIANVDDEKTTEKSEIIIVEDRTSNVFDAGDSDKLEPTEPNMENLEALDEQKNEDHGKNDAVKLYTRKSETDFEATNSRIQGTFQEDLKKSGIRVLQPPGGFSSGLW